MSSRLDDQRSDWHSEGVHIHCHPARTRVGDGTWRNCLNAGAVERVHSHSYDGPLICGCEEWGNA